jgi:hypothetical protein
MPIGSRRAVFREPKEGERRGRFCQLRQLWSQDQRVIISGYAERDEEIAQSIRFQRGRQVEKDSKAAILVDLQLLSERNQPLRTARAEVRCKRTRVVHRHIWEG